MKRSLLILFAILCFGITKANFIRKDRGSLHPKIVVTPINALPDYNIPFKVNPYCSFPFWKLKPEPSKQNKLAILSNRKIEIEKTNLLAKI